MDTKGIHREVSLQWCGNLNEIVSFGEWLQARRNQLGLTRTSFAKLIGCASITIKKIERDERRPSLQIAELLATHLQIPKSEQDDFIRRARGEFVPTLISPEEMTLAEAQAPIKEEDAPQHNLPPQTTPFFGREQELVDIAERVANPNCRLLTILGAGGMGKTRLGIEAAKGLVENFTDGITYVALAPIRLTESRTNTVAGALANALNIAFHAGDSVENQLIAFLRRKETLLVLDNFEHLLEAADLLSTLIQHAPDLKILVTSRASLNLQEEWLFTLEGLPFPNPETPIAEAMNYSAVQLFAQRAQQLRTGFQLTPQLASVIQICRLVGECRWA